MLKAGKKAMVTLCVALAIFAYPQPWKASAFRSVSQTDSKGQSDAVAESTVASNNSLGSSFLSNPKLFTFRDEQLMLESMQQVPSPKPEKPHYATAKATKVAIVAEKAPEVTPTQDVQPVIEEHHVDSNDYQLNADVLFDMVNNHRTAIGLPALQKDDRLMQIAQARAPEIFDEIFVNGNMHAGFYNRNLPYWATENIIYYHNEEGAFNWWMHSAVHRSAIEGEYQFTGIGCEGKACSMIFSNFVSK